MFILLIVLLLMYQVRITRWSVVKSSCKPSQHAESAQLPVAPWSLQWTVRCPVRQSRGPHARHIRCQSQDAIDTPQNGQFGSRTAHVGGSVLRWRHQFIVGTTHHIQAHISRRPPRWCVVWTFCNLPSCPVTKRTAIPVRLAIYVRPVHTPCHTVWSSCQQRLHASLRKDLTDLVWTFFCIISCWQVSCRSIRPVTVQYCTVLCPAQLCQSMIGVAACQSVRPSIMRWYWLKTNDCRISQFCHRVLPPGILVFGTNFHSLRLRETPLVKTPLVTALNERDWGGWKRRKMQIFDQ